MAPLKQPTSKRKGEVLQQHVTFGGISDFGGCNFKIKTFDVAHRLFTTERYVAARGVPTDQLQQIGRGFDSIADSRDQQSGGVGRQGRIDFQWPQNDSTVGAGVKIEVVKQVGGKTDSDAPDIRASAICRLRSRVQSFFDPRQKEAAGVVVMR